MFLEMDQWHLGYAQILRDCRRGVVGPPPVPLDDDGGWSDEEDHRRDVVEATTSGGGGPGAALILCGLDADALCAARILSYMLRADAVPYQLRPCGSYRSLISIVNGGGGGGRRRTGGEGGAGDDDAGGEEEGGAGGGVDDVRAVILLNVGAARNLTKLFDDVAASAASSSASPKPRIYVMDSLRPYHLANVHANRRDVVLFLDRQWTDDVPSDGDDLSGDGETTSEDEGSSSEEDDDSESEDESDVDEGETEFVDDDDDGADDAKVGGDDADADRPRGDDESRRADADVDEPSDRDRDYDGEDEGGDDDDDNDSVSGEGGGGGRRRRRRGSGGADDDAGAKRRRRKKGAPSGDDDDGSDDDDETVDSSSPSAPPQEAEVAPRDLRKSRLDRIRLYYSSGSHHGAPSSWTAYSLARQLRFGDVGDLLWLACVGVSDSYVQGRLDVAGYAALALDLRRHVRRLYPDDVLDRASNAMFAEEEQTSGERTSQGGRNGQRRGDPPPRTQVGPSENGRILAETEFRFPLLRHTSLLDAMTMSDHVSTKLRTWKVGGMRRLQELLAKMGFPLEECRQPYAFMRPKLKRRLREMVNEHAEEYGLRDVSYSGFVRVTGYKSLLSASDASYAITALLECDAPDDNGNDNNNGASSSNDDDEESDLVRSFNLAYDALNSNASLSPLPSAIAASSASSGPTLDEGRDFSTLVSGGDLPRSSGLGAGIRLAASLNRTVSGAAIGLIERNAITRLNHFRYAYLHCTSRGSAGGSSSSDGPGGGYGGPSSPEGNDDEEGNEGGDESRRTHAFAKPLTLSRLARYLFDVHRENDRWTGPRARPLVLLAEKPRTRSYVVGGYEWTDRPGQVAKNRFGKNFEMAARTMRGTFRFDGPFDGNVVEVAGKDVRRFVEQLHYMMDSL